MWGVSLTHRVLASFFSICGVSLKHRKLIKKIIIIEEFLLHIITISFFNLGCFCYTSSAGGFFWLYFYLGSFSYTSRADFNFIRGFSLTHLMLASFSSEEFLLHIPCWFYLYAGNLSYTSHAAFIFVEGVCLTHPSPSSFLACPQSCR